MALIANVVQRPRGGHFISRRLHLGFTLVEMLITMALIIIMFVMLYGKSSRRFQHEQKAERNRNQVEVGIVAGEQNRELQQRREHCSTEAQSCRSEKQEGCDQLDAEHHNQAGLLNP